MVQRVEDLQQFSCLLSSAEDQLIVVDFYAKWCAPCKAIAPKLALMAEELKAHCVFLKVDVDEAEDVAEKYKVKEMPTFLLFLGGRRVGKMTGSDEKKLEKIIYENLP